MSIRLSGYLRAQLSTMLVELGPQRAVITPFWTLIESLNLADALPTQSAETSVSPLSQADGQPFDEHEVDATVRMLVAEAPSLPGGPGGPAGPCAPCSPFGPGVPRPVSQPASAMAAVIITIKVPRRIPTLPLTDDPSVYLRAHASD